MASNLIGIIGMASTLIATASKLIARASNLIGWHTNFEPRVDPPIEAFRAAKQSYQANVRDVAWR